MKNYYSNNFLVFDLMGRIPAGLTEGVVTSFGEFDECLHIESPHSESLETIYCKYCLATHSIQMPTFKALKDCNSISFLNKAINELIKSEINKNVNTLKLLMSYNSNPDKLSAFRLGICIPSKCKASDIQNAINKGVDYENSFKTMFKTNV